METVCTLALLLAVILNNIELSSQSQRRNGPSSRIRSRSPTLERTFPSVLGFNFEDLESIRLRPHNSPDRVFELRKYIFPRDKPIGLRTRNINLLPMPTGEQIVLSTSNGDAYAILDKAATMVTILRAICTPVYGRKGRAKINMNSGRVEALTDKEIEECPVTVKDAISTIYEVSRLGSQSEGSAGSDANRRVQRSGPSSSFAPYSSHSARSPPPAASLPRERSRSPIFGGDFTTIFGYGLEDLDILRLVPKKYPDRRFRLRRYIFPQDKPIGLITIDNVFYPMPTGNQIVLSTSNDEICAILEKSRRRFTLVHPLFTNNSGVPERVKINMNSGSVEVMTDVEKAECPGTGTVTARKSYRVVRL